MDIKVGKQAIAEATEKLKNWGRWGKDDQIGTLNHVTPEDIVKAASLIRTGKVFALGIPLDRDGPADRPVRRPLQSDPPDAGDRHRRHRRPAGLEQDPLRRRHADAVRAGRHPLGRARPHLLRGQGLQRPRRQADRLARALNVLGIEHSKNKMVGRGVLLDIARFRGVKWMQDGESISNDELDKCAKRPERRDRPRRLRHRAHRADGALPRREGMGRLCRRRRAGREVRELLLVPGEADRRDLHRHLGREVRPNETTEANQPWHWVVIPAMGLCMGEIFYLKELAEDCERGRHLRILLLRPAADHHRRHRLADQSAGDQITRQATQDQARSAGLDLGACMSASQPAKTEW